MEDFEEEEKLVVKEIENIGKNVLRSLQLHKYGF